MLGLLLMLQMRPQLLERMPALDEEEYARNLGVDVSPMAPAPLEGAVNGGTNLVDTPVRAHVPHNCENTLCLMRVITFLL